MPFPLNHPPRYLVVGYERKAKLKKETDDCKDTPLEVWYSLCEHLIRSQIKKEDSSMCLVDLMERYSVAKSKYGPVYRFIKELMEGKYPSNLTAYDSIVFLSLINELTQFIQNQELNDQKEYVRCLFRQLDEQASKKRLNEDENLSYLNYFEQIDPIKLREDIQQASDQLNNKCDDDFMLISENINLNSNQQVANRSAANQTACKDKQSNERLINRSNEDSNRYLIIEKVNDKSTTIQSPYKRTSQSLLKQSHLQQQSTYCDSTNLTNSTSNSQASFVSTNNDDNKLSKLDVLNANQLDDKTTTGNGLISEYSNLEINKSHELNDRTERNASNKSLTNRNLPAHHHKPTQNRQLLSSNENPFYQYGQLPRIKKIKECLNPLGISIKVTKDLHSTVTLD